MTGHEELPLDAVVWDPSIYPRAKWSASTIARYAEALGAGEEFPPVVVEADTILAVRREERRAKAQRLHRLGWTQTEIGKKLGVSRESIRDDLAGSSTDSGIFATGHAPEEIARRLGLPVPVVLAQQFDGLDDRTRLDRLGIKLQPYDVWHFNDCHDVMGDGTRAGRGCAPDARSGRRQGHRARSRSRAHMAGSGTTLDACLLMGRKARGYDLDDRHDRVDVEAHDLSDGWPASVERAALVFWDPPYFDKMDGATMTGGYVDGSISGLAPGDYVEWLTKRFAELHAAVRPGTRLAFLMSDWDPEHAKRHASSNGIFLWDYADRLRDTGWRLRRQVQCPLPTQQVHPDVVVKFRDARRLARLARLPAGGRGMSAPRWRGYGERQPLRDLIRETCRTGRDGLAVEDVDLVLRRFGPGHNGERGRLRLVEHKFGDSDLGFAQTMTFGLIDDLLRRGDPFGDTYDGFYLVRTPRPHPADPCPWCGGCDWSHHVPFAAPNIVFRVNGHRLDRADFRRWCEFEPGVVIDPLRFLTRRRARP